MDNKSITAEVMDQYEQLRRLGPTNMLDLDGVQKYAKWLGFDELAEIAANRKNYTDLLMNFSHYMVKYGITQ